MQVTLKGKISGTEKRVDVKRKSGVRLEFVPCKLSVITSFLKQYCEVKSRPLSYHLAYEQLHSATRSPEFFHKHSH